MERLDLFATGRQEGKVQGAAGLDAFDEGEVFRALGPEDDFASPLEDVHSERPDETTSHKLRRKELAEALLRLNPRMRRVLSLRFGLNGEPPQTLEEVGIGLGITRERVRQLESRALRELRAVAPDLQLYLRA